MTKITRRDFLKLGFTSAAVASLGGSLTGCFSPPPESARRIARTAGKPVIIASTCLLCPAGCGILGEVADGRLIKIVGNPKHPNNRGKICSRGHAGVNTLYDPDRLLYPLKRTGARGEGRWTRITWDQAMDEIAKRLTSLSSTGKTEAFWVEMGAPGSRELLALNFLKEFGSPSVFPESSFSDPNRAAGQAFTWGAETVVGDVARSRFILNFGANPYEDHEQYICLAQRIVEGRMANAAKLVTLDVRLSNTAGKSNEWIPVNPGTDGIIALAMVQHILQHGLHNKDFLSRWTNFPLPKLIEHLAQYTPEQAEKISGVKAADIRRMATEFAQANPAVALTGRGVSGHQNGVLNERCIALLNAVVGNIDVPGGCCLPRTMDLGEPKLKSAFVSSSRAFAELKERKAKAEFYFSYMGNPAYANPGTTEILQILQDEKRLPFIVVADTHLTETGALADLLLPMASYLESWNLESRPAMELIPFVSIRQPMVPPLGKSRSIGDTFLELARRIGGNCHKTFPYASSEDFIGRAAGRIEGLSKAGGIELLKKEGVWFDRAAKPVYRSYAKKGFATPSGKFEVFSKPLQGQGLPALPTYVPIKAHQGIKEEELILTVNRANVMTPRLANAKWLAEILHDNPLWINPKTAQARGIRDGDRVNISSKAGSLTVRVRFSQGVHPRVVTLTEGLGHWELGKIARAKKEKSSDFDTQLLWWEKQGNGVNPSALIAADFDPLAGGIAWNDTRVTLTKI
ncbi:MAG: molybdopterin-dependent oxidoreductase [Thermodesulfobacteriota bacterium]|nr:molybdopterin-dependent oxidoreductase [Thermodesulfobacteriota bacterium]